MIAPQTVQAATAMSAAANPAPSIATMRQTIAQSFRRLGLPTPEFDARLLVAHALALDHAGLIAQSARLLSADEAAAIAALAERRRAREPVARIIGVKEFWGLPFKLNPATLVPRPESETVVEAALSALDRASARNRPLRVADLGTGSGALLLALLSELPSAWGIGTDLDTDALACARANADALGLSARARFVACDLAAALDGGFDLIVSNPPYVAHDEIATLAPEVRLFDPALALDGGRDGLDAYRAITATARDLLAPHGVLVLELGIGQEAAVEGLLAERGLAAVGPARRDLLGLGRALIIAPVPVPAP
jgi:release factor glutamine methyltransferase